MERRLEGRRVSGGGDDDDDDRMMMMMPSARVSCRKANLPTTLMAVRAHPILKLRFKPIMDQAPLQKRETGGCSRIRVKTRLDLGSFSLILDGCGMVSTLTNGISADYQEN